MLLCFRRIRFAVWQRLISNVKTTFVYSGGDGSDYRFGNEPGWYYGDPRGFRKISDSECPESAKLMIRDMSLQHATADMFITGKQGGTADPSSVSIEACLFSCPVMSMVESKKPSDNAGLQWALQDDFFSDLPRSGKYIHARESLFPIDTYLLDQQAGKRYREIVETERNDVLATERRFPTRSALRISACFDGAWLCVRPLPYRNPFNFLRDIEMFFQRHVHEFVADNCTRISQVRNHGLGSNDREAKMLLWGGKWPKPACS